MLEIVTIRILYDESYGFLINFLNYEQRVDKSRVDFYWTLSMKNLWGEAEIKKRGFLKIFRNVGFIADDLFSTRWSFSNGITNRIKIIISCYLALSKKLIYLVCRGCNVYLNRDTTISPPIGFLKI